MSAVLNDLSIEIRFAFKMAMRNLRYFAQMIESRISASKKAILESRRPLGKWLNRHAGNVRDILLAAVAIGVTSWLLTFREPGHPILVALCWTFLISGILSIPMGIFRIATNQPAPPKRARSLNTQYHDPD
jgi:hypothetical protein